MNANPQVGGPFAHPKVQQAVRHALDYDGILALAGPGAVRLAGVIPTVFPGALDPRQAIRTHRDRARALLREANLGEVKGALTYASDATIWGIQMNLLAQKIQADLDAARAKALAKQPAAPPPAPVAAAPDPAIVEERDKLREDLTNLKRKLIAAENALEAAAVLKAKVARLEAQLKAKG